MDCAGEDRAEDDPQVHRWPPDGAGERAEDGAKARDVQKLDQERAPDGERDVVHAVRMDLAGRPAIIRDNAKIKIEKSKYEAIKDIVSQDDKDNKVYEQTGKAAMKPIDVKDGKALTWEYTNDTTGITYKIEFGRARYFPKTWKRAKALSN